MHPVRVLMIMLLYHLSADYTPLNPAGYLGLNPYHIRLLQQQQMQQYYGHTNPYNYLMSSPPYHYQQNYMYNIPTMGGTPIAPPLDSTPVTSRDRAPATTPQTTSTPDTSLESRDLTLVAPRDPTGPLVRTPATPLQTTLPCRILRCQPRDVIGPQTQVSCWIQRCVVCR